MSRILSTIVTLWCLAAPLRADEIKIAADDQAVIDATNAERAKAGLPSLAPNAKLMLAAFGHANNMAKQSKLEHTLDGQTAGARVKAAGYDFRMTAENIAWNTRTPAATVQAWMESAGHKKNILTKEYTEIGVAVALNAKGELYWVQVFGTPLRR